MKIDTQAIISDLKAKQLPLLEKDLVVVVDSVIGSIRSQAQAQPGDAVAMIVGLILQAGQPALDAALNNLIAPPAAPAAAGS